MTRREHHELMVKEFMRDGATRKRSRVAVAEMVRTERFLYCFEDDIAEAIRETRDHRLEGAAGR